MKTKFFIVFFVILIIACSTCLILFFRAKDSDSSTVKTTDKAIVLEKSIKNDSSKTQSRTQKSKSLQKGTRSNKQDTNLLNEVVIEGTSTVTIYDGNGKVLGNYNNKKDTNFDNNKYYQIIAINNPADSGSFIEIIGTGNLKIRVSDNPSAKIGFVSAKDANSITDAQTTVVVDTSVTPCEIDLSNKKITQNNKPVILQDTVYFDDKVSINKVKNKTLSVGESITLSAQDDRGYEIGWRLVDDIMNARVENNGDGTCKVTAVHTGKVTVIAYSEKTGSFDYVVFKIKK